METPVVQLESREQLNAITAFLRALNVNSGGDDQNSGNPSPSGGDKWFLNIKNTEVEEKGSQRAKQKKNVRTKDIRRELFE